MKISSGVILVFTPVLSTAKSTMRKSLVSALALIGLFATTSLLPAQEPLVLRESAVQQVERELPLLVTEGPMTLIMALDADGTNLRTVGSIPQFPIINSPEVHIMHNPEWSPDGSRVCVLGTRPNGNREFATVSAEGSEPGLQVCCNAEGFNPDIGWSKDGRRLIIPHGGADGKPGQLYVYDFETKGEPTLLEGQPSDRTNHGNDWSPDGKTLYFASTK